MEHVPPRCLFPHSKDLPAGENLRKNLITVPSCDEHNREKSGDDQHLMHVLAMNLPAGAVGESLFATKVVRSIQRRPALAARMLSTAIPVVLRNPSTGEEVGTVAIQGDGERVSKTLELVARGIYFHHFGKAWAGPLRVVPEFFRWLIEENAVSWNASLEEVIALTEGIFANAPRHGANAGVFSYQVVETAIPGPVVMRMRFYGGCNVVAIFDAPGG